MVVTKTETRRRVVIYKIGVKVPKVSDSADFAPLRYSCAGFVILDHDVWSGTASLQKKPGLIGRV